MSAFAETSPLTFRQEGGRLIAIIEPDLLETDFVLHTLAAAITPASTGARSDPITAESASMFGAPLASGALRLQRAGDSLVLLEYTSTTRSQLQYRRRDVMPILRITPAQALIVEAAPLWTAVGRQTTGETALWQTGGFGTYTPEPTVVETAARLQPRDPRVIGARLDVLRLPKQPMQSRLYDPRVRFLKMGKYITRWRLEKKDPAAPVSDVVEPIVFRLSESVPAEWISHVVASIEKWNPVFEAIGFRRAIVVRLAADLPASDREFVIQWNTADAGQTGGRATPKTDPRTGEILGGTITINVGFINRESRNVLLRGELDPRTPLPLPDSIGPILLDDVVIHEAGHALGLAHNFKGSAVYPTDSLRRLSFLRRMGSSASVMAYASGNYVAQQEDGVPFMDRRAGIGPYDRWAIAWGYRPVPEATTAEEEMPILEGWRAVQDTAPYLQSSLAPSGVDPTDQPFTGGNDPVKSTEYGLRNLTRLVAALAPERDMVIEVHPRPFFIAKSWNYRMTIAASVVGGATPQPPYPMDLAELQLLPIDSAQQVRAMQFVLAHLFYGQDELIAKYVLGITPPRRPPPLVLFDSVTHGWYQEQWQEYQKTLLTYLVERLATRRLSDQPGTHTALCQEVAALKERLSAAASTGSDHAKELHAIVAKVFAPSGKCR